MFHISRFACGFVCARMSSSAAVEAKFTKLFYNNDWHDAKSGKVFPAVNPADGSKICDVAEADKDDVTIAVDLAKKESGDHKIALETRIQLFFSETSKLHDKSNSLHVLLNFTQIEILPSHYDAENNFPLLL